ncbi:MAG: alpha/beta hydrolase family protein, partial [Phycisphaerales bacterium]
MSGLLHPVLGLAALLSAGALLAWGLYAAGVWRDAVRPPRRGMAWALAQGVPTSPADLGRAFEERTVRGPEASVPGWWVTGRGPADGPTVILVHGHGRSRWDSLRRIGPWVERSPLVILIDLRGHGDAGGHSTLGRREHVDLEAVVAEAERRRPGVPVELVGHSLGAVVAIRTAARRAAAGAPLAAVHAFGPYEWTRTPLEARLRARGLPARPASDLVLALAARRWRARPGRRHHGHGRRRPRRPRRSRGRRGTDGHFFAASFAGAADGAADGCMRAARVTKPRASARMLQAIGPMCRATMAPSIFFRISSDSSG